eukprot:TRINITY_DN6250_c0_g1_i6.p1 TRINITY_DN6250_c0_g1~~TRINITY_DN6250_c0_g1_i6.p1  ORF type:complete len:186 (-),score=33.87 TRINITY_DN6250_c0_g1_i6:201-758(-)
MCIRDRVNASNGSYQEINPFCHPSLNVSEAERVWYYNDNQNCIQGPFTSTEMYEWYKGRYFHPGLLLRYGKNSPFITLRDFFVSVNYRGSEEYGGAYYEGHGLAMEDLAGRFSPLSLESPRGYYQPQPMVGYVAQVPAYFQNYPSSTYVPRGYVSASPIRVRGPYPGNYPQDQGMFFTSTRPSYR